MPNTKDQMFPTTFERRIASVVVANCILGVCATGRTENGAEFVIVAADPTTVEAIWDRVMEIPLNRNGLQSVAIVGRDKLMELE